MGQVSRLEYVHTIELIGTGNAGRSRLQPYTQGSEAEQSAVWQHEGVGDAVHLKAPCIVDVFGKAKNINNTNRVWGTALGLVSFIRMGLYGGIPPRNQPVYSFPATKS